MSDPAAKPGHQQQPRNATVTVDPLFLGAEAPPLEGEERCICGQLEGEHRSDGTCPASGCAFFVAEDAAEETTRPDIVVEYEPGCEPAGLVR